MSYVKQNFKTGDTLEAIHLNNMEDGIEANEKAIENKQPKGDYLTEHQKIKTINGQSLIGEGNIEITTDTNSHPTDTAADIVNDLLNRDDTIVTSFDLTKNFRSMLQPTCIDYNNAGTVGNTPTYKPSTDSTNAITKCSFGQIWYMCNRDFTFTIAKPYEFCFIGLTADWKLALNSGYKTTYTIKKYDPNDSTTFPWFSIIIHHSNNTTDIHTAECLNDIKNSLTVNVSREDIDANSDFPLVLGLTNFTAGGVMDGGTTDFTTYGSGTTAYRNTLSLAYPIMGEEQVEQTVKITGWYQGLTAFDANTGAQSHTPGRYASMAWVETLKNENLFVYWSKTNDNVGISTSTITYAEAEELSKHISIKKRSSANLTPYVMGLNDEITVYSHRIEAELSPKNSIHALEYGYNRGFRWFELDIRLTSDGIPVSSHDAEYGSMSVPSSTYAQLCTVDYGATHSPKFAGARMLKLEDALIFCSKMNCGLNIELKPMGGAVAWTKEKIQVVYDLIAKYNMIDRVVWNQNIYLGTEATNTLQWLLEINNTSRLVLLNNTMSDDFITKATTYLSGNNVVEVYAPASSLTQTQITSALAKGLKVGTHWVSSSDTIDPAKFKTFKDMGITSIITESGNPAFYTKELL